ncbi:MULTISPECIES: ead/Ea22-like family protein [Citrobacter]|uniref:ead/Ea22-like family protein n=1 Tax=Citrobacter TaxID=544 RepID=UPI0016610C1E|nr:MULTISPECIES: ead/Ea22-like family protein [Citrobacter]MBD0830014.1 ead/Ea22-like family protein [Citrobacter sp. C1]
MTALNKQALRKLAKALSGKEWVAFAHKASGTYAVGSLGHERGEDIIKWPGLDGQDNAENKAKFIAAANPAAVLALLDELEEKDDALKSSGKRESAARRRIDELLAENEVAEKRIAELEERTVKLPTGTEVNGFHMLIEEEVIARLRESGVNPIVVRAAGIGVKGE